MEILWNTHVYNRKVLLKSLKKENAYEYIKNENAASQQVFNWTGGHGAAILRCSGQPP